MRRGDRPRSLTGLRSGVKERVDAARRLFPPLFPDPSPMTGRTPLVQGAGAAPGLSAQGGTNSLVSVDALQEFKIQTSFTSCSPRSAPRWRSSVRAPGRSTRDCSDGAGLTSAIGSVALTDHRIERVALTGDPIVMRSSFVVFYFPERVMRSHDRVRDRLQLGLPASGAPRTMLRDRRSLAAAGGRVKSNENGDEALMHRGPYERATFEQLPRW